MQTNEKFSVGVNDQVSNCSVANNRCRGTTVDSDIMKGRQLRIHCSDSEWSFSKNRISVTRITTAQIEIKWDLITKT